MGDIAFNSSFLLAVRLDEITTDFSCLGAKRTIAFNRATEDPEKLQYRAQVVTRKELIGLLWIPLNFQSTLRFPLPSLKLSSKMPSPWRIPWYTHKVEHAIGKFPTPCEEHAGTSSSSTGSRIPRNSSWSSSFWDAVTVGRPVNRFTPEDKKERYTSPLVVGTFSVLSLLVVRDIDNRVVRIQSMMNNRQ